MFSFKDDPNTLVPFGINYALFTNALYQAIEQVKLLDGHIVALNATLTKFVMPTERITNIQQHLQRNENKQQKGHGSNEESNSIPYYDIAVSTGKIAESSLNIYSSLAQLSPALKQAKNGVQLFNSSMTAFGGLESLTEATVTAGGMAAAADIFAGAEGIIAASAMLGPEALLAAVIIAGTAAAIASGIDEKRRSDFANADFSVRGLSHGNQYLSDVQNSSASAESYIARATRPKEPTTTELANELLRMGGTLQFDWRKAESKDGNYLQALVAALNVNDKLKSKPIKQLAFGDEKDKIAFQEQFDKLHHFPTAVNPPIKVQYLRRQAGYGDGPTKYTVDSMFISQKEYEQRHYKPPVHALPLIRKIQDGVLKSAVQSYMTNGFGYVQKEYLQLLERNPNLKSQINTVWNKFLTVKQLIDSEQKATGGQPERSAGNYISPATRPSITINLNKPMIGNFTINVRDIKEGMNDFKHKVEEVLLEILNNANAIQ